jgi:hypothetical protein
MTSRSTRAATSDVTGHTYSSDFTTTAGAFDRTWAGDPNIFWGDAFVAKIAGSCSARFSPGATVTFDWSDVAGDAHVVARARERRGQVGRAPLRAQELTRTWATCWPS